MENYIVLAFGNRRVVLLSPDGRGATYTQHIGENGQRGHSSFAFSGCRVVGYAIVEEHENEPTLAELFSKMTPADLPTAKYLGTTLDGQRLFVPRVPQ